MVLGVFLLSFDHHLEAYDATSKIQFQPCKLRFLHFFRKSLITATRKCQNNCHSQTRWIDFAILRRQYFRWSTYVPKNLPHRLFRYQVSALSVNSSVDVIVEKIHVVWNVVVSQHFPVWHSSQPLLSYGVK